MTRVEAPSRLHFGLLSIPVEGQTNWPDPVGKPGLPIRSFGGVGLMIDKPGVVVEAVPALAWSANGVHAERALVFAQMFIGTLPEKERRCFHIRVLNCPPEHIGLGVGTSLGLSVAKAIAVELGYEDWDSVELAKRVGRGKRSAVGVHGFQHGGMIVEAGKLPGEPISPMIGRFAFPDAWRVVLIYPHEVSKMHGEKEKRAFEVVRQANDTDSLCRIVLTGIQPALMKRDLDAFGAALSEFNYRAGAAFRSTGETFASRSTAQISAFLKSNGIRAVGQSSWGPIVFVMAATTENATSICQLISNDLSAMKLHCEVERGAKDGAVATIAEGEQ